VHASLGNPRLVYKRHAAWTLIHTSHPVFGARATVKFRRWIARAAIAEPDRDWFTVQPGEVPCEACLDAIQPPERRRAAQ